MQRGKSDLRDQTELTRMTFDVDDAWKIASMSRCEESAVCTNDLIDIFTTLWGKYGQGISIWGVRATTYEVGIFTIQKLVWDKCDIGV